MLRAAARLLCVLLWVWAQHARGAEHPDPQQLLEAGLQARKRQDLSASIAAFQTALLQGPLPAQLHEALTLELAITLAFDGRHAESLARYDALLAEQPRSAAALLGKARVLPWMSRAAASLAIYRELLSREPDSLEAKRGMAAAYLSDLDLRRARQVYGEVLRTHPGDAESVAGLKQAREVTRFELTAIAGISGAPATGWNPVGALRAVLRSSPRLAFALSYQLDAPFLYGDRSLQAGWRHRAEAGVLLRLGRRLDLAVSYQVALLPETIRHAAPIELSVKLPRDFVVIATARPGIDQLRRVSLLASLGLQYHLRPDLWLMAQLFRYDDAAGEHATAFVGTLNAPILHRWMLKVGGAYGLYTEGAIYAAFAENWLRLTERGALGLLYQYSGGFMEQHAAALAVRWRF